MLTAATIMQVYERMESEIGLSAYKCGTMTAT